MVARWNAQLHSTGGGARAIYYIYLTHGRAAGMHLPPPIYLTHRPSSGPLSIEGIKGNCGSVNQRCMAAHAACESCTDLNVLQSLLEQTLLEESSLDEELERLLGKRVVCAQTSRAAAAACSTRVA